MSTNGPSTFAAIPPKFEQSMVAMTFGVTAMMLVASIHLDVVVIVVTVVMTVVVFIHLRVVT